jgi:PKD repeat protein
VKGKKEDRALSELFRQKLDGSEVIPSPGVNRRLMRRLGRKEFFHFIPRRFNIWYAGAIITTATLLTLMLISDKNNEIRVQPSEKHDEQTVLSNNINQKDRIVPQVQGTTALPESSAIPVNALPAANNSRSVQANNKTGQSRQDRTLENEPIPERTSPVSKSLILSDQSGINKLRTAVKGPDNLIRTSVREGCVPLKVVFSMNSIVPDSCLWSFGDGGYAEKNDPEWLYDIEGEYNVELQLFTGGVKTMASTVIIVHPRPAARFEITSGNSGSDQDEIRFLNYSTGAEKFRWDFGDGKTTGEFNPGHKYAISGTYNVSLTAISAQGCSDTLSILSTFGNTSHFIRFPNAFIPNQGGPTGGYYSSTSDESAQVFHPFHSGVAEYQLRIFTRRGILVFETTDVNIGWDGYYKGQLVEPGVYIWKIRGSFINGEPFTKMGDVTLLKY